MARIRIGIGQINQTVGAIAANVDRILSCIDTAQEESVDLVVFPELAVCGYPPDDLVLRDDFASEVMEATERIANYSQTTAASFGSIHMEGADRFNSAVLVEGGRVVARYDKTQLPNYSVFDEQRIFQAGRCDSQLAEIAGVRLGAVVCEDAWYPEGCRALAVGGAELIVVINASPFAVGRFEDRLIQIRKRAVETNCAIVYVNAVGGQDELVFDGGSFIVDADGNLVARAVQFSEQLLVCDVDIQQAEKIAAVSLPLHQISESTRSSGRRIATLAKPLNEYEEIYSALVLATRDYVFKNSFEKVVLGISGGIDSAVVAAIAVEALGPEAVVGVLLPSPFTSEQSNIDAMQLAENLGIETLSIPIGEAMSAFDDALGFLFEHTEPGIAEENIQSRIRGMFLMALSNKFGWLVLTTGNKSEYAVGYCTLYGDMAGGFAVLKDVLKTDVYGVAAIANRDSEVIPKSIIHRAPTAELRTNQLDSDSLPAYDVLDQIIAQFVEKDRGIDELSVIGATPGTVSEVVRLINRAEYKRRQAPPGPKVSAKAFGRDRRLPITNRYGFRA